MLLEVTSLGFDKVVINTDKIIMIEPYVGGSGENYVVHLEGGFTINISKYERYYIEDEMRAHKEKRYMSFTN